MGALRRRASSLLLAPCGVRLTRSLPMVRRLDALSLPRGVVLPGLPWSSPSSGFGLIRCGGVKVRVRCYWPAGSGRFAPRVVLCPGCLTPARALGGTAGGVGARVTLGCALRFPVDVSTVARARGTVQASRPMFFG